MASIVCFATPFSSFGSPVKPPASSSNLSPKSDLPFPPLVCGGASSGVRSLRVKAAESSTNKGTKINSIVCGDCDGNGAKLCTQCEGTAVNAVDHFNGRFKAGGLCWLCRGKKEILCGNCNGAGFLGGFLSTFDETSQ